MNADAYFAIGKTHTVCEDYAKAIFKQGGGDGGFFAFLSDGCSSSSDTDIGARLLVTAALVQGGYEQIEPQGVIQQAASERPTGLSVFSLDATFLGLIGDGERVQATVSGDGVLAGLRRDGSLDVWDVVFPSGAPGYPSYLLALDRLKGYVNGRCVNKCSFCDGINGGHGKRQITVTHDGVTTETLEDTVGSPETWAFKPPPFTPDIYRAVFAFSDGVHSFQRDVGEPGPATVPMLEVVKHLTAIKGFAGSFMIRRAMAFLGRHCRDNKWHHNDDVSAIAIDLGE